MRRNLLSEGLWDGVSKKNSILVAKILKKINDLQSGGPWQKLRKTSTILVKEVLKICLQKNYNSSFFWEILYSLHILRGKSKTYLKTCRYVVRRSLKSSCNYHEFCPEYTWKVMTYAKNLLMKNILWKVQFAVRMSLKYRKTLTIYSRKFLNIILQNQDFCEEFLEQNLLSRGSHENISFDVDL